MDSPRVLLKPRNQVNQMRNEAAIVLKCMQLIEYMLNFAVPLRSAMHRKIMSTKSSFFLGCSFLPLMPSFQ